MSELNLVVISTAIEKVVKEYDLPVTISYGNKSSLIIIYHKNTTDIKVIIRTSKVLSTFATDIFYRPDEIIISEGFVPCDNPIRLSDILKEYLLPASEIIEYEKFYKLDVDDVAPDSVVMSISRNGSLNFKDSLNMNLYLRSMVLLEVDDDNK